MFTVYNVQFVKIYFVRARACTKERERDTERMCFIQDLLKLLLTSLPKKVLIFYGFAGFFCKNFYWRYIEDIPYLFRLFVI